ncbi:hypothetical protein TNCV_4912951 [Trichonephila clavipes]|nr:hypothetical protein TNCV_4912951 [Trichonephila clavipes]
MLLNEVKRKEKRREETLFIKFQEQKEQLFLSARNSKMRGVECHMIRKNVRLHIWTLVHHVAIVFLKLFSHPRRHWAQLDRLRQLSPGGETFMPIMTSSHSVEVDPKPNNGQ